MARHLSNSKSASNNNNNNDDDDNDDDDDDGDDDDDDNNLYKNSIIKESMKNRHKEYHIAFVSNNPDMQKQ